MKILITGADGFIGKNLQLRLSERSEADLILVTRQTPWEQLEGAIATADVIFHLAGENRPSDPTDFDRVNRGLTQRICASVRAANRQPLLVLASSIQAAFDNPYGKSKLAAEEEVRTLADSGGCRGVIYRLPNVFGKWAKPNYNSAVATFCHNRSRDLPITVNDPSAVVRLVYVDDVIDSLLAHLVDAGSVGLHEGDVSPVHVLTVGELAAQIEAFKNCRSTLISERVGAGFVRKLYATYVSYLPTEKFAYAVTPYADPRGVFVEMLKTQDSGQFSFFTAHPGVTRGGHYHHTKTEKFLVIRGQARFKFRHMSTGERFELSTSGESPKVVETVPGWTHDITNMGSDELIVMLWANEIFDRAKPDTVACQV